MDREEKVLNWAAGMDGKRTLLASGGLYGTLGERKQVSSCNSNLDSYRRGPIDGVRRRMTGLVM